MSKKVLFWNINGRGDSFIEKLKSVVTQTDILLLAESEINDDLIKKELNLDRIPFKSDYDEQKFTPKLYSNISNAIIEHYSNAPSKRLCFFTLKTKEYGEIILGGIHFPSKATYRGETQLSFSSSYSKWIREVEEIRKHKRTIIFGDFNMNPFEQGMIEPKSFNATLSYEIAKNEKRTSHFEKFDYFYNPMWSWFGDKEHKTGKDKLPGSFYYKTTADVTQIYWNVFDKVIVRPELIDAVDYSSIEIIEALSRTELMKQDCENKEDNFTDHLPLTFKIKITT